MLELWDAYDSDFNRIEDMTLIRGENLPYENIPDGLYHLVCDVLVRHDDGSYLLMQRAPQKHFGGMWEASAGGSALKGEGPLECATRELREETGIISEKLTEIGRVVNPSTHSVYTEFLCETSWNKDSVILQEGETSDHRWVSSKELKDMALKELVTRRILDFIKEL